MTLALGPQQFEPAQLGRDSLPIPARIAVGVLVALAVVHLPSALVLLAISSMGGAGTGAFLLVALSVAIVAIPSAVALGIWRRSRLATVAGVLVAAYALLGAVSELTYRASAAPGTSIAVGLANAIVLACLVLSWRGIVRRPADAGDPVVEPNAAQAISRSPRSARRGAVKVAAWIVGAAFGLFVLVTVVAPLAYLVLVAAMIAGDRGPGSLDELRGMPEFALRYPGAELLGSGGQDAEVSIDGPGSAMYRVSFHSVDPHSEVIAWHRDELRPPRWIERGNVVGYSQADAFVWCSDAADARLELVYADPRREGDPDEYTLTAWATEPDATCR